MSSVQAHRTFGVLGRVRLPDAIAIVLVPCLAILWTLAVGKDVNFDQLNYHFYLGFSFFHDRLQQDFMPASGQSYLNPVAYVPFYWMIAHDWPSMLIASVLAAFHSLNIIVCYFIARTLVPQESPNATPIAFLSAALSLLSPIFLTEVGTSFADVTTSAFVLTAVLLALHSDTTSSWWKDRALWCGLAMGIACGMKLSNLVFGPACAAMLFIFQPGLWRGVRALALLGVGSAIGAAVAHGFWGLRLWKSIGNPFFPFFENYFPTDILPKEGANLERFLPESVWDSLTLPFRMVQSRSWIHIESVSPDLRFAALALGIVLVAALFLWKRTNRLPSLHARRAVAIWVFFVVAYGLWQWTSGNGRYGLTVSLLCGPLLGWVAYVCFKEKTGIVALGVLAALQIVHAQSGDQRWSTAPWTRTWYDVSIPERLKEEPFLYVSVGNNSNSFVYPYLHPQAAFTNPLGQTALDLDGAGGRQLKALFKQHAGRIRFLAVAPPVGEKGDQALPRWKRAIDAQISRLGFAVDSEDCEMILASGPIESGQDFDATAPKLRRIGSCRLVERRFAHAEERARMTRIARSVVEWCPKLFKPAYTLMERTADAWSAAYPATDSMLVIKDGSIFGVFVRSNINLVFGTVEAWEQGKRPSCDSFPDKPRETYNFD